MALWRVVIASLKDRTKVLLIFSHCGTDGRSGFIITEKFVKCCSDVIEKEPTISNTISRNSMFSILLFPNGINALSEEEKQTAIKELMINCFHLLDLSRRDAEIQKLLNLSFDQDTGEFGTNTYHQIFVQD
jgi:hypothetical protein